MGVRAKMPNTPSPRAQIITRRTYNRPLDEAGSTFETWDQTVDRVIGHQAWLWKRAAGRNLKKEEKEELEALRQVMLERKALVAGRSLWLGGTEVAKRREASQFNCSFTNVETVFDVVDVLWLLLQGCGVGFKPIVGTLNGFFRPIPNIEIVRSTRTEKGGNESNAETFDAETGVWTLTIGDSAEAWAKSVGKLLAGKYAAKKLVLDFSQIRPAGQRLAGYGWISSGDGAIATAYSAICAIMNRRAGSLLTKIDILDMVNWLGTILSSRRSAEIALCDYGTDEWREFASAKSNFWACNACGSHDTSSGACGFCGATDTNHHRQQSNNTVLFDKRPSRSELDEIFSMMIAAGGSEPGFANLAAGRRRAPWMAGLNPCAEILLGNKSFCNLTEVDVGKFKGDSHGLRAAVRLAARANYRQTCVNLLDGILQEAWHLNNEFLRLCGVSLTGIVRRPDLLAYDYRELERTATAAAYSMADELGLPHPKNVTTNKPSGTLAKIMDTTEGMHRPLGRHIFNNVSFHKHDPLVGILRAAGYRIVPKPKDVESVLITLPVSYPDVPFDKFQGRDVNLEPAIVQLERYKLLLQNWCQQNVSATIYYDVGEKDVILDWLEKNWDDYVAVSFLFRTDPTITTDQARQLGYDYLPQEVVTKETYDDYVSRLSHVDLSSVSGFSTEAVEDTKDCPGGSCPIR